MAMHGPLRVAARGVGRIVALGAVLILAVQLLVHVVTPRLVSEPAAAQLPRPTGHGPSATWNHQAMTGGPSLYWACLGPDKIIAMQAKAWRGTDGLWPDASLTAIPGGCLASTR